MCLKGWCCKASLRPKPILKQYKISPLRFNHFESQKEIRILLNLDCFLEFKGFLIPAKYIAVKSPGTGCLTPSSVKEKAKLAL